MPTYSFHILCTSFFKIPRRYFIFYFIIYVIISSYIIIIFVNVEVD